jgi:hypothetical protein
MKKILFIALNLFLSILVIFPMFFGFSLLAIYANKAIQFFPTVETYVENPENPFSPLSNAGLNYIANGHHSIIKEFDYAECSKWNHYDYEENIRKEVFDKKSSELIKLIEDISGELFFQTEQVIDDKKFKNVKFWVIANYDISNLIKRRAEYTLLNHIKPIVPNGYCYYKTSKDSPSGFEVYETSILADKIIVGIVDYRLHWHSQRKNEWDIGQRYGGKEYYAVIKISNYKQCR